MPQLAKGGKFVFGRSIVSDDLTVRVPDMTVGEYGLGGRVILMSGSRTSGGFRVSSAQLLKGTVYGGFLRDIPALLDYTLEEGACVKHKNSQYCWVRLDAGNRIVLTKEAAEAYGVKAGDGLIVIRGSNIASVFASKGPLVELAEGRPDIPEYR